MQQEPIITSTRDRILEAKKRGLDYSINSEAQYIQELKGFMVRSVLTIYTQEGERQFSSFSFRRIDMTSEFSALETADTVSTGRCFGKTGIGIDAEFGTGDELVETPTQKQATEVKEIIKDEPKKRGRKPSTKTVTTPAGKEITVDLTTGITHTKAIEATMAVVGGDSEHAQQIIEETRGQEEQYEIEIPELEENGKRNLRNADVKAVGIYLSGLGVNEDIYKQYIEDSAWGIPDGADTNNLRYEFLRHATVDEIKSFINHLK